MTPRVIVAKGGREYLCWIEEGEPTAAGWIHRWRCGACRRGFIRPVADDPEHPRCSVCRARVVETLIFEPPGPAVPIPPRGKIGTTVNVERVPHGWDVVVAVRALNNEHEGRPLSSGAAGILAWQGLSDRIRKSGGDLAQLVARLPDAIEPVGGTE